MGEWGLIDVVLSAEDDPCLFFRINAPWFGFQPVEPVHGSAISGEWLSFAELYGVAFKAGAHNLVYPAEAEAEHVGQLLACHWPLV